MTTPTSPYGGGITGSGLYGVGDPLAAVDRLTGLPILATHVLGVGARSRGVVWRGAANYGRPPNQVGKGGPEVRVPNPTRMSATLRRDGGGEAAIEWDLPRNAAWVAEELVTDLWWWRRDPYRAITEPIGRFNADNVDPQFGDNRLRISTTWVDYRELMEARIVTAPTSTYPIGTSAASIIAAVIPDNIDINTSTLLTNPTINALGNIKVGIEVAQGDTVKEVLDSLRENGIVFDYSVDMAGVGGADFPVLKIYPGGRGLDKGVSLVDTGSGPSPIQSWRRTTNGADYATTVLYRGVDDYTSLATMDATNLPTGPRDVVASGNANNQAKADLAARQELSNRSTNQPSWSVTLAPGWWQGLEHINVGDVVKVNIALGEEVISGTHLVDELSLSVDNTGVEEVVLTLGRASASVNPRSRNSPLARLAKIIKARRT